MFSGLGPLLSFISAQPLACFLKQGYTRTAVRLVNIFNCIAYNWTVIKG
jgi:hypothetical protein